MQVNKLLESVRSDVEKSKIIPKDIAHHVTSLIDDLVVGDMHNTAQAREAMSKHVELAISIAWLTTRWRFKRDQIFYDIYRESSDDIRDRGGRLTENEIVSNIWSDYDFTKAEALFSVFEALCRVLDIRGRFLEQISNNIRSAEKAYS